MDHSTPAMTISIVHFSL